MKKITTLFLLAFSNFMLAQSTNVDQVLLNGQTTITGCNTINLGTVINNNITFYYTLSNGGQPSGTLYVKFKYSSGTNPTNLVQQSIQSTNWSNGMVVGTITCSLNASDIQVSGSSLYLEFVSNSGTPTTGTCIFPLIKTPTPSFTLTPTSQNISCGDTSSRTFTVTASNIPAGITPAYSWSHSGWTVISQTATSKTLQPNFSSTSPSNVRVTPYINNVEQATKTSTITISPFFSGSVITGNSTICNLNSASTYNLVTPPGGGAISVVWSSSNTAIATVSGGTSTGVTVNSLNQQGTITLTATITNQCGQTATKTFTIKVGNSIPSGINVQKATGYLEVCGNGYHYIFLEVINPDTSQSVYNYTFSDFNTGIANPNVTYVQVSPKIFRFKIPKNKIPSGQYPVLVFNFTASNVCGVSSSIYGKAITMDSNVIFTCNSYINQGWKIANPDNNDENINNFTIFPNPSSDVIYIDSNRDNFKENNQTIVYVELYDLLGKLQRKTQLTNENGVLDVKGLTTGIYILKIDNNGEIENHKIIVK